MHAPRRFRLPVLALALTLATCAARRPAARAPLIVQQAEELGPTDRMQAIAMLEDYLAGNPDPEVEPWALVAAGEQRRLAGDDAVARRWFDKAARGYPDHPAREIAVLGLALLDARETLSGNTLATLQLVGERAAPDSMNADRYRLLARLAADEGTPRTKVYALVDKAVEYARSDRTIAARVQGDLGDLLREESQVRLPTETPQVPAEQAALVKARSALAARRFAEAIDTAKAFQATWPDSPHAREAGYIVRRAQAGDLARAGRVGVMLPASGTYAPAGQRIREVIELVDRQMGDRLDLVFYDTGEEGANVVKGVEQLAIDQGCVAILGPLLKEDVMDAANTAQAIGVPMVALSQSAEPAQAGDFVFRGFLPLSQQVDALLDHAMRVEGIQTFAMLHPATSYGEATRDLFVAGVEARGGKVVRIVAYDPDATNYLETAQKLGQKDYTARAAEWWKLKKEAEKDPRKDPDKVVLPPIVDFDAIFIPDSWRRVALVASSLAYEEFPVGAFRPDRHAERIPLFGLNGWNDPHIVEAGGQYVQKAVFVDAFLPGDGAEGPRAFARDYEEAFKREPGVVDALAYDAARMVATAVLAGGDNRLAIRDELTQVKLSAPAAGGGSFGADREVARKLKVLTVRGDRIVPWEPPEEQLPAEGIEPPPGQ